MTDNRISDILSLGHADRATDRSRRVIELAVQAADDFCDTTINSCHLLCGLYYEDGGVAHHTLQHLGLDNESLKSAMLSRKQINCDAVVDDLPIVMNAAMGWLPQLNHNYYGTEHLLLGVVSVDSLASKIISDLGIRPDAVTDEVLMLLGHHL